MSEVADEKIARLEQELKVAQELLAIVLDYVGEPVRVKVDDMRASMQKDRVIDLSLDEEAQVWTLRVIVNE